MRVPTTLVSALVLLAACRNDPPPRGPNARRPAPARPAATAAADSAAPAPSATATTADSGAAAEPAPAPPSDEGVRAFRVADSACIRDPSRNALGLGVHGYFGGGRLEVEVRNVRYSCTPPPVYVAALEEGTVHIRVPPPDRAALARCQCRHDQFLQITGVPQGDYTVVVEEIAIGDAGTTRELGRGNIVASAPEAPAPATDGGAATSTAAP
ncbi:MAG: hypothetical protein U0324_25550 [Polyangiales bacterium]